MKYVCFFIALLLPITEALQISGYALGRAGTNFNQIGPVLALTTSDAKALLTAAMKNFVNKPVVIDIPEDKTHLLQWLSSLGFRKERPFIRMFYKKNTVHEIINKHYAICGPEFG